MNAKELYSRALELPRKERAELAVLLIASLQPPVEEGVDEAWAREIERRCAAVDAGTAATSDWNTFQRRVERDIFRR